MLILPVVSNKIHDHGIVLVIHKIVDFVREMSPIQQLFETQLVKW